jgi:hypothetical protein
VAEEAQAMGDDELDDAERRALLPASRPGGATT